MAELQLNGELVRVLERAGCSDVGGVSMLANPTLAPSEQLADLRRRFPAAFVHARDMSPSQFRQACAEATRLRPEPVQVIEKHASVQTAEEYTQTLRLFGIHRRTPR